MKFDLLYNKAKILGCDYIATGHYAIIKEINGQYELHKGADASKDQGYVLYRLTQEQLAHTIFLLGYLSKNEVRKIAEDNGFLNSVSEKHYSQRQQSIKEIDRNISSLFEKNVSGVISDERFMMMTADYESEQNT